MVSDYDDLLNSKYKNSNLSYQDILNDPSSVYYSDVKMSQKENKIRLQSNIKRQKSCKNNIFPKIRHKKSQVNMEISLKKIRSITRCYK